MIPALFTLEIIVIEPDSKKYNIGESFNSSSRDPDLHNNKETLKGIEYVLGEPTQEELVNRIKEVYYGQDYSRRICTISHIEIKKLSKSIPYIAYIHKI